VVSRALSNDSDAQSVSASKKTQTQPEKEAPDTPSGVSQMDAPGKSYDLPELGAPYVLSHREIQLKHGGVLSPRQEPSTDQPYLTITDSRTGKSFRVAINNDTIPASIFKQAGVAVYDPGYLNTAVCRSKVCYIDGDNGILRYRGYPIEQLAEHSTFLEVAYLIIYGELPTPTEYQHWQQKIMTHTYLHENLLQLMKSFRYDAHPMGMLISTMAAMSTFHPEANPALQGPDIYKNPHMRNKQIFRILGKLPTVAACAYRHRIGRPYNYPSSEPLSYTENFLYMLDRLSEPHYKPDPRLARALDVLFIIHADHELNCSTAAMRHLGSSLVDPFTAVSGAAGALFGPLHGGANEAVLRMLESIGSIEKIPAYIEAVKQKKKLLFGFGHRIYKNYDPRAKILKRYLDEVYSITGKNPLLDVAYELERIALSDEYFVSRKLYPV